MKKIKFLVFILVLFFTGCISVSAKEIRFYFNLNGGTVSGDDFYVDDYGYLSYQYEYYASYTSTIKNINTIKSVKFTAKKNGTSLVKGREWYLKNTYDGKTYFFSESSIYNVDTVFKTLGETGTFASLDLYANWSNSKISGIDMKTTSSKDSSPTNKPTSVKITTSKTTIEVGKSIPLGVDFLPTDSIKETITWSSSNKKIATVSSSGVVKGIKKGTATITATSKDGLKDKVVITIKEVNNNSVNIIFNINGGSLNAIRGSKVSLDGQTILCNNKKVCVKALADEKIKNGLPNFNNPTYINMYRSGYYINSHAAWNTKADGTGKTYGQVTQYTASTFCDASEKDCTVTLYANWKKADYSPRIAMIGNSKTSRGVTAEKQRIGVSYTFRSLVFGTGRSAKITTITKGGSNLLCKAKPTAASCKEEDRPALEEKYQRITSNYYDIVILQEQTDRAFCFDSNSSSAKTYGSYNEYLAGVKESVQILKNQNAKIYIRSLWPNFNRPEQKAKGNDAYSSLSTCSKRVATAMNADFIDDSRAFKAAKDAGINLYLGDNNHANEAGSYLAAACIYKRVFNVDVSDLTYYHLVKKDVAQKLLAIAQKYC